MSGAIIGGTSLLFSFLTDGWYFYYTVTVPKLHGFGRVGKPRDQIERDRGSAETAAGCQKVVKPQTEKNGQDRERRLQDVQVAAPVKARHPGDADHADRERGVKNETRGTVAGRAANQMDEAQ